MISNSTLVVNPKAFQRNVKFFTQSKSAD